MNDAQLYILADLQAFNRNRGDAFHGAGRPAVRINDVTPYHANPQAIAPLLYQSSAAPHSTLPQLESSMFLRRDLRQWAD